MNLEKRYKDSDGNDCTIMQMVLREPEWAANRIQAGEDAIHKLQNTSSISDYAVQPSASPKLPSWDEVYANCTDVSKSDVQHIMDVVEKLGNFA